jgi:hypothetical protein
MFNNTYSFGKIEVHQSVIDEMQAWLDRNNRKVLKFTRPIIEQAIAFSIKQSGRLSSLTDAEMARSHRIISTKEASLGPEQKGLATSKTDKDLLAYAWKNKSKIATQERTMRSIGALTIGHDRILSFEELIVDLIEETKITTDDVTNGLEAISRMNEKIDVQSGKLIQAALDKLQEINSSTQNSINDSKIEKV